MCISSVFAHCHILHPIVRKFMKNSNRMIGVLSLSISFSSSLPPFTNEKKNFLLKALPFGTSIKWTLCKVTIFQSTFHTTHADYRFPKRAKPQQRKSANHFFLFLLYFLFFIFIVFLKMQRRRKKNYMKIVFALQTKDWKWDANNNKIEVL